MNQAIASVEGSPLLQKEGDLLRVRAIAHLRKAEIENCVNRHNRDCCIFPLQGGGVHTVSSPAREAKEDFLRYLEIPPLSEYVGGPVINRQSRVAAKWLLNIACMALDEYPKGVPEKFRMPPLHGSLPKTTSDDSSTSLRTLVSIPSIMPAARSWTTWTETDFWTS